MSDRPRADQVRSIADAILKEWADRGKIIEGGWRAFVVVGRLQNAPTEQLEEMRKAYMLGAQHLWASINSVLDPGEEPSERDLARMTLIDKELEAFRKSLVN